MGRDFEPLESVSLANGHFQELPISVWQSCIMPIMVVSEGIISLIGTGFNIAPTGILVTARHVALEALNLYEHRPNSTISVMWMSSGAGEDVPDLLGGLISVRHINMNDSHDVALLQLEGIARGDEPLLLPCIPIDSQDPAAGDPIFSLGYTKMDFHEGATTPELRQVDVEHTFHGSHGEIVEVYPEQRDSVMIHFPALPD